MILVQE